MPGLVSETATLLEETAELREVAKKREANVAVSSGLHEEVLATKKAVAALLSVAGKRRDVQLNAEMKVRLLEMES